MTQDESEARAVASLAIGRLLRIGSRPERPGDTEEYFRVRSIIMDASEAIRDGRPIDPVWQPNYARGHNRGAAGS